MPLLPFVFGCNHTFTLVYLVKFDLIFQSIEDRKKGSSHTLFLAQNAKSGDGSKLR